MKCPDFKRLALSNPYSNDEHFLVHDRECLDCHDYRREIKQLDNDLDQSLDVQMPSSLTARLQLSHEMSTPSGSSSARWWSIAAGVMLPALIGMYFFAGGLFTSPASLSNDYEQLLSGVFEHLNEQPINPVWSSEQANRSVSALLASYDPRIEMEELEGLQFGRICPLGEYRGLHATLQTSQGLITFAYIKGDALGDVLDASYQGQMTRVKPVPGGNLVIISQNQAALDEADFEISEALYWDI